MVGGGGGGGGGEEEEDKGTKEGSVVTENPKGITENFGRIQRRDHLENEDIGRGWGDRESHQMLLGGITIVK